MSHKIKIYIVSMGLFLLGVMQLSILGPNVLAAPARGGQATPVGTVQDIDCPSGKANPSNTGCVALGNDCKGKTVDQCLTVNPITHYINITIAFLSGLVGIVVVAVIIIGGIQYSMAGGNATALQAARQKITNGLIALFAFIFLFAFLQWLVPGGL